MDNLKPIVILQQTRFPHKQNFMFEVFRQHISSKLIQYFLSKYGRKSLVCQSSYGFQPRITDA